MNSGSPYATASPNWWDRCVACGAATPEPFYANLLACPVCTHVWARVDLPVGQLEELYGGGYFAGEEYTDYVGDRPTIQKNFALRLKTLRRYLDPRTHRRLFEIGCAHGYFLELARPYFDLAEGIDISRDAVDWARDAIGADAIHGDLLAVDLADREYDVVCLWDTVEHLMTPDLYIRKIAGHMPRGSVLALTTGDIGSLNARLRRQRWRLIHPPTHVHYFTRASVTRMLDRLGFDVAYVRYCGFYRSIHGIAGNIFKRAGHVARLPRLLFPRLPVYINLYDIILVIAVKRE